MKRAVQLCLLSVIALIVASSSAWAEAPVTFRVEQTRLDIGEVKAGNDAVGTFVFHNDGDKDVRIIKAKPS